MRQVILICFSLLFLGCTSTESNLAQMQYTSPIKQNVLINLYKERPGARAIIGSSAGYVVFSRDFLNAKSYIKDNYTGEEYFTSTVKLGIQKEEFNKYHNVVVVFHTQAALNDFLENGWHYNDEFLVKPSQVHFQSVVKLVVRLNDMTVFLPPITDEIASLSRF